MHKTTANPPSVAVTDTTRKRTRCFALSEQLACVQIFLASANVHVHYRAFQQADGLSLLVRVLQIDSAASVTDADRCVILNVLQRIAQRGRAHKEEISRAGGELAIVRGALSGAQRCQDMASPLWVACRDALLEQLAGNPNSLESVHGVIVFMLTHDERELQIFGAQAGCGAFGRLSGPLPELVHGDD